MKSIFDKVSNDCSKLVIKRYSTSFYFSSSLLSKSIRQDIFNIYGFVRLADEIVDTFHEYPKKELLEDAMKILNGREKEIIVARRLSENPQTLEELSKKYKISRERIRQIETKAFEKLQKSMINASKSKNLLPVN